MTTTAGRCESCQHDLTGEDFIRAVRIQGVRTREVDQVDRAPPANIPSALPDLDGRSRPVPHGATGTGQCVEERGLADIGSTGEQDPRIAGHH